MLREQIKMTKEYLQNLTTDNKIVYTLVSTNTGELIDACNDSGNKLIQPFAECKQQNYYYYVIPINNNIDLKVKSKSKKLKKQVTSR